MKIGKMHVKPYRVPVQFTMARDTRLSHKEQVKLIQHALNYALAHASPRVTLLEGFNA